MYRIEAEGVIDGTPEEAWAVQIDVAGWPSWNSHELAARLDGPFVPGTSGWTKPRGGPGAPWVLTEVDPPHAWSSRSPLPGGALTGRRQFTATAEGRLRCAAEMSATGPLELLFRLWFGRRIRADLHTGFAELEAEIARRRTVREHP